MRFFKLSFLLVTVLVWGKSYSQFRKYSNEFLNIGAGARGLGMGGSQIASVSDGTSGYWNPAALVNVKDHPSLSLMHAEYFAGIGKYEFAGIAIPTKTEGRVLGISLLRFAVDDIPNTLYLVNPDGSLDYNNISSFSSADYALLLSYAQKMKPIKGWNWSMGGNAKIIYRKVGTFASAIGFGLDAGAQFKKGNWQLGIVVRDMTTTFNAWSFTFSDREKEVLYLTQNDIPVKSTEMTAPRLILGGGYNFNISKSLKLLVEANLHLTFDGRRNSLISSNALNIDPTLGMEAAVNNVFFVRAGISNFQRGLSDNDTTNQKKVWIFQPSLGAGFKIGNAKIDYALSNLANQSNPLYSHVFSLKIDLINQKKKH